MVVRSCALPRRPPWQPWEGVGPDPPCFSPHPLLHSIRLLAIPARCPPRGNSGGLSAEGSGWGICSPLSPESWFCFQTEKPILSPAHQQWGGAKAFLAEAHGVGPPGNRRALSPPGEAKALLDVHQSIPEKPFSGTRSLVIHPQPRGPP